MKPLMISVIIFFAIGSWAAENPNAITITATELKSQPEIKASALLAVPTQTRLIVGERQGAWYKAAINGKSGWIKLLSIKLLNDKAVATKSGLADLAAATKGTKSTTGTGIRGLTAQKLENAEENRIELAKLENHAVDSNEALTYARSANLASVKSAADKE